MFLLGKERTLFLGKGGGALTSSCSLMEGSALMWRCGGVREGLYKLAVPACAHPPPMHTRWPLLLPDRRPVLPAGLMLPGR